MVPGKTQVPISTPNVTELNMALRNSTWDPWFASLAKEESPLAHKLVGSDKKENQISTLPHVM